MAMLTSDWTLDVLLCAFLGLVGLYVYLTRNSNYWKNRGVKEIPPKFFFGNVASCVFTKQTPDQFLNEIYRMNEGEKMVGFYVFDKPYLMLRDPELVRHVFIKDFGNFSNKILSGNDADLLGSRNLFLAKNPPWKHIRQKLTPVFTSGKLKKMFELMLVICQDFDDHLTKIDIDDNIGKPLEVTELSAKLMTDLIGTTAFGMKFNSLNDPEAEFRKYGREMFRSSFKRYWQMLSILFIPSLRPYTNAKFFDEEGSKFLRSTFWHIIKERIKSEIKRYDLIDMLIEIKNNQEKEDANTYKLEGDALVAQAAVFFSGGFETTSTTLSFAFYELAKSPEVQSKLREELLKGIETFGGKVTYEMVMSLPYLDQVVHEVLRMYPVLPWLDRIPETDYTFPGTNITVEKGTPIILPMRCFHMDSAFFPDPEKFNPERFSEQNKKNITSCTYFPFGEGPRNCIGSRLGLMQVKLGVIYAILKYELSPCADTPIPMKFDKLNVLTHSEGGLEINFKRISK